MQASRLRSQLYPILCKFNDRVAHRIYFLRAQLRIKRQAEDSFHHALGDRKRGLFAATKKRLLVEQVWIMDHGFNAALREVIAQSCPLRVLYDVKMMNMRVWLGGSVWKRAARARLKSLLITLRQLSSLGIPSFQMIELNAEQCGLYFVKTRIASSEAALQRPFMSALTKNANTLDQFRIVRYDCAAIAESA